MLKFQSMTKRLQSINQRVHVRFNSKASDTTQRAGDGMFESLEPRMLLSDSPIGSPPQPIVDPFELSIVSSSDSSNSESQMGPSFASLPVTSADAVITGDDDISDVNDGTLDLSKTFDLHSNTGANHTVYLDFDGHITTGTAWNSSGNPSIVTPMFNGANDDPNTFSNTDLTMIQKIWAGVAEDFAPFNINVTTEDPGVDALSKSSSSDPTWGVRVLMGDTTAFGNIGGVAYLNSFNWSSDTPVFVRNVFTADRTASHEVGHALGLHHDGNQSLTYYPGHGSGETGWMPIMGSGSRNLSQWSNGDYAGANNQEDDLAIISSAQNGFGYRTDDHGDSLSLGSATLLAPDPSGNIFGQGIIERNTDDDVFAFTTNAGNVAIDISPATYHPNLDILANLYDDSGSLIASNNPLNILDASFNLNLDAGQYFLEITGTGKGDPLDGGYSDYATLGNFWISGSINTTGGTENIAPTAVNDTANTIEDEPVTIDVLDNDFDPNGDELTVASVTQGSHGLVLINDDNTLDYTPDSGFTGTDSFTYIVSDGKGGQDTAAVEVVVVEAGAGPDPTGLVAHWTFDETSGTTAADSSPFGNDNSGTLQGNADWSAVGRIGGALSLVGSGGYVAVPNTVDINTASATTLRTVSAWFNTDYTALAGQKQVIYEEGGTIRGLNIYLVDGELYVGGWNTSESGWAGTFLSTNQLDSGKWHHVTLVLDGTASVQPNSLTAYIDGVEFGSGNGSQLWAHSGAIGIGQVNGNTKFHTGNHSGGSQGFAGKIDDVRVYNRALSESEAQLLAQNTTPPGNQAPVAVDDTASVDEGGSVTIDVLSNDVDPDDDTLSVVSVTQGSNGLVLINDDNTVDYSPNSGFSGSDSFTYTLSDGNGGIDIANVDVTVNPTTGTTLTNGGFEDGLSGWEGLGDVSTQNAGFGEAPAAGDNQATLTTRNSASGNQSDNSIESFLGIGSGSLDELGNNATVGSAMKRTITVEAGSTLTFSYNFLTNEATPESTYNDFAFFTVSGGGTEELIKLVDTQTEGFASSASTYRESTGYLTFSYTFTTAGVYTIGFGVTDVTDTIYDSALLIDDVSLS